jgi:predicted dehydrogenase
MNKYIRKERSTMTTQPIRWGILGTGRIAGVFAEGLKAQHDAKLVAVGSRTAASAQRFADKYSVPRVHGSYADLAHDPEVDAIYVATPHPGHMEETLRCIDAGKAVLCEKPFAINTAQAQVMLDAARAANVPLMEAMWTRFLPIVRKAVALINEGAIGEVRMIQSDFGFRTDVNPSGRLFDRNYAGGGLLDVGVYCVSLSVMLLGENIAATGMAEIGSTGVDEQGAAVMSFADGRLAYFSTGVRTSTPMETTIMGTEGQIRLESPWFACKRLTLTKGGKSEVIELPFEGNGYHYEATEVGRLLREKRIESDIMSWNDTMYTMEAMDRIRAVWGLRYPME